MVILTKKSKMAFMIVDFFFIGVSLASDNLFAEIWWKPMFAIIIRC